MATTYKRKDPGSNTINSLDGIFIVFFFFTVTKCPQIRNFEKTVIFSHSGCRWPSSAANGLVFYRILTVI